MAHSNGAHQYCTDANKPAGGDGLDERDESANTPIGSADSQRARLFEFDGLQSIRRYYQTQGFSENIIITDVLVNSWRPATQKQHKVYIKKWCYILWYKENYSIFARFKQYVGVLLYLT